MRVEPQELRIGNWITVMGSIPTQVTAYHLYMMETDVPVDPTEANYKEMINAIPLTEEWLLKFGFEDISDLHPTFRLNQYIIEENVMRSGRWRVRQIINAEDSLCISPEIMYVHRLQNFFFEHGTELTIKETV